jgi:hypothetical protein
MTTATALATGPALTAADRCDRCQAQAYVRVTVPRTGKPDGELLFCAHHAREHWDRLGEVATSIHDETRRLKEPARTT